MEEGAFVGFRRPETEFYSTPNEWTDISADIDNLAELKIIEYIMRHTWGFKEKRNGKWVCDYDKSQKISTDEFMYGRKRKDSSRMDKGTKLSKQSVITGVEKAVEHGYIVVEVIKNGKYYKLKMLPPVKGLDKEETESVKELDKLPVNDLDSTCQEVRQIQARKKETPEIQLQKETLKEGTFSQAPQFTSQEKQIYDDYCLCFKKDMPRAPLPNVTEKLIRDIAALATGVNTQEEMQSLFAYAKARIRGDNPRVYPANLLYWIDAWKVEWQAQTFALPGPTERPEPAQAVYREHTPLPVDMQMWMIDTANEFGVVETVCVNELEWCFQHTGCTEEEFYSKLIRAYEIAKRSNSIDTLFAEFKQSLSLVVDAVMVS